MLRSLLNRLIAALLLITVADGAAVVTERSGTPISTLVDLGYAQYKGVSHASGINQYLKMRYAAPPTGNNRFRAPQAPVKQSGIQDASSVCGTNQHTIL